MFISHREKRLLFQIEKATNQKIEQMAIPSISEINESRLGRFKTSVIEATKDDSIQSLIPIIESIKSEAEVDAEVLMAALAKIAQGDEPLLLKEGDRPDLNAMPERRERRERSDSFGGRERGGRNERGRGGERGGRGGERGERRPRERTTPDAGMKRFRIDVGHVHHVKPGNIVGAIANEAGLDAEHIGHINIQEDHSLVDLPMGMPKDIFRDLKKTWVCGRKLEIVRLKEGVAEKPSKGKSPSSAKSKKSGAQDRKPRKARKSNNKGD